MTTEKLTNLNPFSKLAGKADQTAGKATEKGHSASDAFENHKNARNFSTHLDDNIEKPAPTRRNRQNDGIEPRQKPRERVDHHDNRAEKDVRSAHAERAEQAREKSASRARADKNEQYERSEDPAKHPSETASKPHETNDRRDDASQARNDENAAPQENVTASQQDGDENAAAGKDIAEDTDSFVLNDADGAVAANTPDTGSETTAEDEAPATDTAALALLTETDATITSPLANTGDVKQQSENQQQNAAIRAAAAKAQPAASPAAPLGDAPESSLAASAGDNLTGEESLNNVAGDKNTKANPAEKNGDLAQTAKDTTVIKDAADALAGQNPAAKSPAQAAILARNLAGNGQFTNALGAPKTESALLQAADGGEGTASLTTNGDGKVTTPASQLRAAGYTSPTQSVALQIAQKVQSGTQQFEVRMNPPELGRVDVRLEFGKDGQVTTHLIVERPETLEMLSKDSRQLERALQQAGVSIDSDGLTFSLKDQGEAGDKQQAKSLFGDEAEGQTNASLEDAEDANIIYRRIAPPNGIDISI